jgi:hypothetical protein
VDGTFQLWDIPYGRDLEGRMYGESDESDDDDDVPGLTSSVASDDDNDDDDDIDREWDELPELETNFDDDDGGVGRMGG